MVVSILGCGWFGTPLAKDLIEKGHIVKGSTTSDEKLATLASVGIKPYKLEVTGTAVIGDSTFFACDVLIVSLTPRMRENISYQSKVKTIVSASEQHSVKKIILISSTGVYGEYNTHVNEDTAPNPNTDSGKAMLEAEEIVRGSEKLNGIVLRFGGLVGSGRHPGRFLAGKKDVANGQAPVNIIHLTDCVNICCRLIEEDYDFNTLNAVCPDHPTREVFYNMATSVSNMEAPIFTSDESTWKIVESKYVKNVVNYDFVVADLLRWLVDK